MYKIRDCQFDCRYYADGHIFKSKKEIAEELIQYHSIDFSETETRLPRRYSVYESGKRGK